MKRAPKTPRERAEALLALRNCNCSPVCDALVSPRLTVDEIEAAINAALEEERRTAKIKRWAVTQYALDACGLISRELLVEWLIEHGWTEVAPTAEAQVYRHDTENVVLVPVTCIGRDIGTAICSVEARGTYSRYGVLLDLLVRLESGPWDQ